MPIMEPDAYEDRHEEDTPLTQAQRNVCATLRRALRRMRQERQEQICLDMLSLEDIPEDDWHTLNMHLINMQEVDDPDLLRFVALYAPHPELRTTALWRLLFAQQMSNPKTRAVLNELANTSNDEHFREFVSELIAGIEYADTGEEREIESDFWDSRRTQKSILNPHLPSLCADGLVDPDDLENRMLIECLVHAQGHAELRYLLPEDRLDARIERWWRDHGRTYLIAREDDVNALEDYVLHGNDEEMRAIAFSRLTGFWHWERCDAFSHVTYSCTSVRAYDGDRALRLCAKVLATTEPSGYWRDPTPPLGALREGAYQVTEHVLYGRVFWNDLTFVGERARAAAAQLGQDEGIEHWLLGCLLFCFPANDERHDDAPYFDVIDEMEDIQDARRVLAWHSIDGGKLYGALMRTLSDGGTVNREELLDYFDAAQRSAWHGEPGTTTVHDLLEVILRYPTETICRAMNRLALLSVLKRSARP